MKIQRTSLLLALLLLGLATLGGSAATAQTELFFATGVDSTGRALAQSNADGHVLIESLEYPRGLWLHLVDETGDALAGLQVEYQGQPDSLVAIRCVDPGGGVRETLVWTRPEGDPLRLTMKPREPTDLPAGLIPVDWQIDPTAVSLEPVVETQLESWEAIEAFLRAHWQGQAGRVAVQFNDSTSTSLAVKLDHPKAIDTLVAHLQQTHQPAAVALGETTTLYLQIFEGGFALQGGVILYIPLFFEDLELERSVRLALGRPQGPITRYDVAFLTSLRAGGYRIHPSLAEFKYFVALQLLQLGNNKLVDLTPLAHLTNLTDLHLGWNQIVDLTPLAHLTNLTKLDLSYNQIADLTPLASLTNLWWLELHHNQITDVTPLAHLTNLIELDLGNNKLVDLTSLAGLNNLQTLVVWGNQITDLTPLAHLNNLTELYLDRNQITDLTPLAHLNNLEVLIMRNNQIVDLTPLAHLNNLTKLYLGGNQIEDLSPLVANPGLSEGDVVDLRGNPLRDKALTEQIPALRARGVDVIYY